MQVRVLSRGPVYAPVAQSEEQGASNAKVGGSSPSRGANFKGEL
jgi:hypothetical protein